MCPAVPSRTDSRGAARSRRTEPPARSRPHGAARTEPPARSRPHGAARTEPPARSRPHGAARTEPPAPSRPHGAARTAAYTVLAIVPYRFQVRKARLTGKQSILDETGKWEKTLTSTMRFGLVWHAGGYALDTLRRTDASGSWKEAYLIARRDRHSDGCRARRRTEASMIRSFHWQCSLVLVILGGRVTDWFTRMTTASCVLSAVASVIAKIPASAAVAQQTVNAGPRYRPRAEGHAYRKAVTIGAARNADGGARAVATGRWRRGRKQPNVGICPRHRRAHPRGNARHACSGRTGSELRHAGRRSGVPVR